MQIELYSTFHHFCFSLHTQVPWYRCLSFILLYGSPDSLPVHMLMSNQWCLIILKGSPVAHVTFWKNTFYLQQFSDHTTIKLTLIFWKLYYVAEIDSIKHIKTHLYHLRYLRIWLKSYDAQQRIPLDFRQDFQYTRTCMYFLPRLLKAA